MTTHLIRGTETTAGKGQTHLLGEIKLKNYYNFPFCSMCQHNESDSQKTPYKIQRVPGQMLDVTLPASTQTRVFY